LQDLADISIPAGTNNEEARKPIIDRIGGEGLVLVGLYIATNRDNGRKHNDVKDYTVKNNTPGLFVGMSQIGFRDVILDEVKLDSSHPHTDKYQYCRNAYGVVEGLEHFDSGFDEELSASMQVCKPENL
jgi:hypothetical protein